MYKLLIAAICATPILADAPPEISPKEMVQRAVAAYQRDQAAQSEYSYYQRDDVRIRDGSGNIKRHELRTFDVRMMEGSPYRRLVRRNDQPLSPEEEKQQQEDFRRGLAERRSETPEQRRQRLAEWKRKRQQRLDDINEVPAAFDFRLAGEDKIDGIAAWIVEGMPHPGYKPKSKSSAYFLKMSGRIWISKDYHLLKIDAVTLDAISVGSFLLRIAQGGHIGLEFSCVDGGLWLPKRATITGSARLLLVKGYQLDADYTFSDYRKAEMVSTATAAY